jgi:hypothetical protein
MAASESTNCTPPFDSLIGRSTPDDFVDAAVRAKPERVLIASQRKLARSLGVLAQRQATLAPAKMGFGKGVV